MQSAPGDRRQRPGAWGPPALDLRSPTIDCRRAVLLWDAPAPIWGLRMAGGAHEPLPAAATARGTAPDTAAPPPLPQAATAQNTLEPLRAPVDKAKDEDMEEERECRP